MEFLNPQRRHNKEKYSENVVKSRFVLNILIAAGKEQMLIQIQHDNDVVGKAIGLELLY